MKDLNRLVVKGRLTRDCELGYMQSGSAKGDFAIAVNTVKKQGNEYIDEANFFNITVWGKTAENLKPYLVKGQEVIIEGYLKQERWEKEGKYFSTIKIVTDNIYLVGGKKSNTEQNNSSEKPQFNSQPQLEPQTMAGTEYPEDIPF